MIYERITNYRIECGGAPLTEYYDEGEEEDQNEGEEGGPALVVQSQNNHRMIQQLNT